MLLPLCHSLVIGLLYRVAGIAQAKLFPQGIAGDVAIVPVQVLHQPFRPLPALYKGAVRCSRQSVARPTSPASGRSTGGMRQGASSPPPCRRPQGRNARFPGRHGPLCSPRISSPAPPRASCRSSAGSRRCHLSTRRSSGKAPPSGTGGMPHPRLAGPPRRHCSPRWPCGAFLRGCRGIVGQLLSGALRLPGGRSQGRSRVSGALPGHIPPGSFLSGGLPVPQSRKASWCGRFPVVPKLQFCFFELVKYREEMPLCHYPENVQEFVLSIPESGKKG